MNHKLAKTTLSILVLVSLVGLAPAPVPRCSPFIIINKLVESTSVFSDSNPYFPVPPCEYGGPLQAIARGDLRSVFVLAEPWKIPQHNFYELVWLLKTGIPRIQRVLAGQEGLLVDKKILNEGYQHYTPYVRTGQLGHNTQRNPVIIDNIPLYKKVVGGKIVQKIVNGPDRRINNNYPYQKD